MLEVLVAIATFFSPFFVLLSFSAAPASVEVEVLLYVHRNRRLIRDRSQGRPPRLSHSS